MSRYEPQYEERRSPLPSALSAIAPGLTLLGGLAIGAGVMYLLDPDEGHYRRKYLRKTASNALQSAGDHLGSAYDSVSDTASSFRDRASDLRSSAGRLLRRPSAAARGYAEEYAQDEGYGGPGTILSLVVGGSLLAGVIYLLTTEYDALRRGDFSGAARHAYHRASDAVTSTTQFARDKASQVADRASDYISRQSQPQ